VIAMKKSRIVSSRMACLAERPLGVIVFMLALQASAGCSDPLGPEQEALDANRDRWAAAALADYRYTLREFCFCGPETLRPVVIEVRDGQVASATYEDDGTAVVEPRLGQLRTVDGLFDVVQDAIDRDAHSLDASYDPTLGYPTSAQIDYIEFAVDEEYGFAASALAPSEGG
jgi:hypothetical protein